MPSKKRRDPEYMKKYMRAYSAAKGEELRLKRLAAYRADPEKHRARSVENRKKNKQENVAYWKEYRKRNRALINKYMRDRYHANIDHRLGMMLRGRLRMAVKRQSISGSAVRDLGCSISDFKEYLEARFRPDMTWENFGSWHIDHIFPLASFDLTKREDVMKACHYTNLQPLWAADNIRKGARIALERRPIYNEVVPQSGQRPTGASTDSAMTGIVMERTLHVRTQSAARP